MTGILALRKQRQKDFKVILGYLFEIMFQQQNYLKNVLTLITFITVYCYIYSFIISYCYFLVSTL